MSIKTAPEISCNLEDSFVPSLEDWEDWRLRSRDSIVGIFQEHESFL